VELSSEIYASLRKKGNPLDDIDILIAGIAIENKNILVTGNATHFGRIKGLNIEDWITL
jgi:tRNA(fMet)-specific endonuclease VapC